MLDLCGCRGGAGKGYMDAGWDVIGVDTDAACAAYYPGAAFVKGDALDVLDRYRDKVDAVHTSPPCQKFTQGNAANDTSELVNLIPEHREALVQTGLPYVIENVPRAPLLSPMTLCGTMFGLTAVDDDGTTLHLRRHRWFESNILLTPPGPCVHLRGVQWAGSYGGARRDKVEARLIRHGGYVPPTHVLRDLLRIDWMDEYGLFQAIPPSYSELIGAQLLAHVEAVAA